MSVNAKMTALADEVRTLSGATDTLGLDEMASHTREANTEVSEQAEMIQQLKSILQGKAEGGTPTPTQEKTVEITTNGPHEVTPDEGYALPKVTVNVNVSAGDEEPDYRELYQRVEYIESTTGCQIVTDIIADNETGMELLATFPTLADRVPMGSRVDENQTRFYVPYPLSNQTIYYGYNVGSSNTAYPSANVKYRTSVNFINSRCAMTKEDDSGTVKFVKALTDTLVQQTAPIGIFCYLRLVDDVLGSYSTRDMIFYGARISQGNEVVREYIPCYRKSDGEIGLYERFTGAFLTNTGSGTFTVGEDDEWEDDYSADIQSTFSLRPRRVQVSEMAEEGGTV